MEIAKTMSENQITVRNELNDKIKSKKPYGKSRRERIAKPHTQLLSLFC